jgi:lipopolysaccharide heptosyltransferase II
VLSTPIFKILKTKYSNIEIDVLVTQATQGILKNNPYINEIIIYKNSFKTTGLLRKRKYDLVIDLLLDYKLKPALITYFSNPMNSIGFDIESRGKLFTNRVVVPDSKTHFIDKTIEILKPLNITINEKDKFPELFVDNIVKENIEDWFVNKNINKSNFVISIHPGGYYPSQRWHYKKFSLLIKNLFDRYKNLKIFLIGNYNEQNAIEKIAVNQNKEIKQNISGIIGWELDKIIYLIQKSNLFIGNNSGLLHIATAVKTPTVSFMGPTIPWIWWPYGEKDKNIVIRKKLECSPCNKGTCEDHKCMDLISVDDVLQAINQVIGQTILNDK